MSQKIKLLYYGDSPTAATGFATVSRNILNGLHALGKYDIKVLGINYWGDPHQFPYPIWPIGIGSNDPYGRQRALDMMRGGLEFDVLLMCQDSFTIESFMREGLPVLKNSKKFTSIAYYPIDGTPRPGWINAMSMFDKPVTYTQFGYQESVKAHKEIAGRLEVIPHGVNVKDFFPIAPESSLQFKHQYLGANANKFLVLNVNRNQQRKDIPRTMLAFKKFKEHRPDSFLLLHMAAKDTMGWDILELGESIGLKIGEDYALPANFGPNQGYPIQVLNLIYNIADVVISTATGEGWGLSSTEAMACRKPIIFPRNTSLVEIIGENEERGYLAKSGQNSDSFMSLPRDNEVIRPLCSITSMAEKLLRVYDNREEAALKAHEAYNWVTSNLLWDKHVVPKWVDLIDRTVIEWVKSQTLSDVVSADEF